MLGKMLKRITASKDLLILEKEIAEFPIAIVEYIKLNLAQVTY